jgi:hypothetical protein
MAAPHRVCLIAPLVRATGALVFVLFAYWLGLLAIERVPALVGVAILLLVPMIGLVVVVMAVDPEEIAQLGGLAPSAARSAAVLEEIPQVRGTIPVPFDTAGPSDVAFTLKRML